MKIVAFFVLIVCAAGRSFATLPTPWTEAGQWNGELYEVRLGHLSYRWNPERDDWMITTKEAIARGRVALKQMVGARESLFECREVKFARDNFSRGTPGGDTCWFFVVIFESLDERAGAKKEGAGVMPAILPFVVWPDGPVIAPTKKKPNQPSEPTR